MKKYLYLVLVTGVLLTGCGKKEDNKVEEKPHKNVVVSEVKTDEISDTYESDATIVPEGKVDHTLDGTGTVKKLYKKNGDIVKKGDIVVELTDSKTKANYLSAKAAYDSAKFTLESTKNNFDKYQKLYKEQLVSQLEFLDYKNKYTDAIGSFESKKANYLDAKKQYDKLVRRAEIDGVVGNLYLKEGNEIKAKENLFTVVNEKNMESTVDFPGKWFNNAKIGEKVYVKISDLGDKEYIGYIKEINPVANPETKKFPVKIEIPNKDGMIKDGMYGKVLIPAGTRETLVVPQEAVFIRDLLSYVYIVKDGVAKRVEVTTGAVEEPVIEIKANGIKSGNEVITDGLFGLEDGDLVNIVKK
ncbi:efflux RND transporter periplasmic adaptor subunit [Cetobacterium sp. SF1]|uniref:efflux RND transporter periplasmic adaptor subunit n=1 Tax=Cetobacterium sp. SF1 TaxID=3417654 RepID=UPI003CF18C5C